MFPFRALRESLTSHQSEDHGLAVAAFELSADVCLRAGAHSEFLKSCQQLMGSVYPAVSASSSSLGGGQQGHGSVCPLLARQSEMAGLWLLYFICVPASSEVRAQSAAA